MVLVGFIVYLLLFLHRNGDGHVTKEKWRNLEEFGVTAVWLEAWRRRRSTAARLRAQPPKARAGAEKKTSVAGACVCIRAGGSERSCPRAEHG